MASSPTAGVARFGRTRTEQVGLTVGAAGLGLLGFAPQFGGPGYEAALGAGLILPSTAAVTTALVVARARFEARHALERGFYIGTALALLGLTITIAHGLRVGICDFSEGLALYALGPAMGTLLGGASGAIAGFLVSRFVRKRLAFAAVAGAMAGPISGVIVSLVRFYTSPMVFAYDPYAGYFSGPLYDTVIGSLVPLATYRLGTIATLGALVAGSMLLGIRDGRLTFAWRARPKVLAAGLVALLGSLSITLSGSELGHYSTAATIESALGKKLTFERCHVVYSSAIPEADAARLARECHAHLAQIGNFFGTRGPETVRVFLFASDVEKGRHMGAARTYIAKPWRREIYIQAAGYPHPVLGHELAHVVAGSFGVGPFRVSGPLGGWLPDPGRIEGVATAAAPDENDALTLDEWAAAMDRLGLLPRLESLFRLSFLGQHAARAYTAAGSFLRFLRAEHGAEALRRWYAGERLEAVTQLDFAELERRWLAALRSRPLSDAALATARARFERPAFFERRCPRVIDRTAAEASGQLALGDVPAARESYREVLRLDPRDSGARLGLAACAARRGETRDALAQYGALSQAADAAPWAKLAALEGRGDVLLRAGEDIAAKREYDALATKLVDADRLRTLDVKRLATDGRLRDAIVSLLIGDQQGPSWDVAAPLLGEGAALQREDGTADYLIGRNLMSRGRLADAARHLDRALARSLTLPRVLEEALRLRVILGCALDDRAAARAALARFEQQPLTEARRAGLRRFAERCGL